MEFLKKIFKRRYIVFEVIKGDLNQISNSLTFFEAIKFLKDYEKWWPDGKFIMLKRLRRW